MPILLPNLDDRRWRDLVDEGRALIPLYASEWTDHNVHDPGVTLMELFAWLAEMDIYRLNRISDAAKLKFLRLVGVEPHPPVAARAVLQWSLAANVGAVDLPASLDVAGPDPTGVLVFFRTLAALTVLPTTLTAVQVKDASGFHDMTDRWTRGLSFGAFGDAPARGAELYLGFDGGLEAGRWLSLYAGFASPRASEAERRRLLDESRAQHEACSPPAMTCREEHTSRPPASHQSVRRDRVRALDSPPLPASGSRLVWEVLAGPAAHPRWALVAAQDVRDDTRTFTLDGSVRLKLPNDMGKASLGQIAAQLSYVRVRFEAGFYDAVPIVRALVANAVLAEQAHDTAIESRGDGTPFQRVALPDAPVLTTSVSIQTREQGEPQPWRVRQDLDASRASDSHAVLDAMTGLVAFGDGEHGRVVPPGVPLIVTALATRAAEGNVRRGTVTALVDSPHNRSLLTPFPPAEPSLAVTNALDARGGAPAESLEEAVARAIAIVGRTERAVTPADFETLALDTPGFEVARAKAWAGAHPDFPCLQASGLITLVVIPNLPGPHPTPSPALRRAVAAYVNRRRLIGTRVEVVAPTYREVAVRAVVQALSGTSAPALRQRVIEALNAFLGPLTGGPDGRGWPFGRDVFRADMLEVIDRVPGVDFVVSLALIADGCECHPQCGNVCIGPTWLATPGQHLVTVQ